MPPRSHCRSGAAPSTDCCGFRTPRFGCCSSAPTTRRSPRNGCTWTWRPTILRPRSNAWRRWARPAMTISKSAALTSGSCATPGATSSACSTRTSPSCSPGAGHGPASGGTQPGVGRPVAGDLGQAGERPSWREPRSPTAPRVEGSGRTVLACPTPSRKRRQPTRLLSRARSATRSRTGRLRWLHRLPLVASRHATVSTVPRFQGQGRPPGQATGKGHTMTEANVSFAGNLTDDPEVRYTEGGIARAMFRVAVSGRREQEASFFTVVVWRDQAEHAAESLAKGSRIVVLGRLQQRSWTAEDGSARSAVEVVAEELGPSLRWATATTTRATRDQS